MDLLETWMQEQNLNHANLLENKLRELNYKVKDELDSMEQQQRLNTR